MMQCVTLRYQLNNKFQLIKQILNKLGILKSDGFVLQTNKNKKSRKKSKRKERTQKREEKKKKTRL